MKKRKLEKGITLVALVITIIVLLILAVVAIGAVRDSGIIGHAQNSADRYNSGKLEEELMIGQYEDAIAQYETEGSFGTSGDGSGNEDIEGTEIYGSKEYGIEFITETTGKIYAPGINDKGYLDVTFSDNKIIYDGESMEYVIYTLENNKILTMDHYEFYTTNGTTGLDNSLLDGRRYTNPNGENSVEFKDGLLNYRNESIYEYYLYDSYILRYDVDGFKNVFLGYGRELSEDLTTFIMHYDTDPVIYTLQQYQK